MRRIIVTGPMCHACEALKAEYPDATVLDVTTCPPPVRFALQMLLERNDLVVPIVLAIAEGNGREARKVLGE